MTDEKVTMALDLQHLDEATRQHMLAEIDRDTEEGCLYISPRLTEECAREYAQILRAAAAEGHDEMLAAELARPDASRPMKRGLKRDHHGKGSGHRA